MNSVIEKPEALLEGHWLVLIEDDPLLQSILSGFVEELGGRVSTFETADDALVHMLSAGEKPSLIVTDHLVPGQIKGAELATMVGTRWPGMSVIVTTGHDLENIPQLLDGMLYLQKPWDLGEMKKAIIQMLKKAPISL
jgi:DNA-binding NtrC family response regulator